MASVTLPLDVIRRQKNPITYVSGGEPVSLDLGQVNYLTDVELDLVGTMTCVGTAANALLSEGPWKLVRTLSLEVDGKAYPLSTDPKGCRLLRLVDRPGSQAPAIAPVVSSASPGTANAWFASLRLPVAVAQLRGDTRGAIWAQSKETSITLQIQFNAESTAIALGAGNTASFAGTVQVSTVQIAAPPPAPPAAKGRTPQGLWNSVLWLHTFRRKTQAITATGENRLHLDTGNDILRVFAAIKNNGDYTTDILDSAYLDVQDVVQPQLYGNRWLREQLTDLYHLPYDSTTGLPYLPDAHGTPELTGIYVFDFFKTHTDRDILHSQGLTQLDLVLNVSESATLTNCSVDLYQEQLVALPKPLTKV